jgi:hypothetical protein
VEVRPPLGDGPLAEGAPLVLGDVVRLGPAEVPAPRALLGIDVPEADDRHATEGAATEALDLLGTHASVIDRMTRGLQAASLERGNPVGSGLLDPRDTQARPQALRHDRPIVRAEDLHRGAGLLAGLPRFLRRPFGLDEARAILAARLARREANLLALVARALDPALGSPYRELFRHAGCELGDVRLLVAEEGVEGALRKLFRAGIYLSVDEYKGRQPAIRGGVTIDVRPERLRNPGGPAQLAPESSGSRGPRTEIGVRLAFVRDHAVNTHLTLDAHGGRRWRHANWGIPGAASTINVLEFCAGGTPPARWFVSVDPASPSISRRYRAGAAALRVVSALSGVRVPAMEHAPLDEPLPIVRWMSETLRRGELPHLWSYASSAVRVCQAAAAAGISIAGARFTCGGEPLTERRRAVIEAAGAVALPRYGSTETDIVGYACGAPEAPDDQHLLQDRHAVVQPGADGQAAGLPPKTLLFTPLLDTFPLLLVNASLGDQAELVRRRCGCPLEALGWPTHLQAIRSFEKLTVAGMMFLDSDVLSVLEEFLPARFGGGATSYQLVEEESDADALPRLRLLVDPAVGPVDEGGVAAAFLEALARGSDTQRVMAAQWRESGALRVSRETPLRTASGKILHLHLERA